MASTKAGILAVTRKMASVKAKNKKLLAENQKLVTENRMLRLLITKMRLLREQESSESSGGEDHDSAEDHTEMAGQSSMREVVKKNATSSGSGDDLAMVSQMNCYSFVPEDDTTSSNEEDPFGVDADGDGCQEADEQMWSINGVWRCAICEKNIRGTRHNRWKHIAMHKKFKVSCPFAACGKYLTPESLRYQHLPRCHNIKGEELDESMQAHMQSEREKHFAEAKKFEKEFFPEENVSEVKPLENDTCKYCGTKVASQKCQEAHIAAHLEMHVVCPVPECDKRYKRLTDIYRHFREAHDQLTMSEELKEEWREAKKAYHNAAAEARNLYF